MFKYTVQCTMKDNKRVTATIKTAADYDITDRQAVDYFAYIHDVYQSIERVFGPGSIRMWQVVDKTRVMQRA